MMHVFMLGMLSSLERLGGRERGKEEGQGGLFQ